MVFKTPIFLILIPFVLVLLFFIKRKQQWATFRFPSSDTILILPRTWRTKLRDTPFYLRLASILLFVFALAGPRLVLEETYYATEGIDIVLAIDTSGSMAAEDFEIKGKRSNRLEVVKGVVSEFISKRKNDRIGLIAFSALAYTVSPLTTDYSWLKANLERTKLGLIEDGTAIGSAIASSLSRLRKSDAESKIIILLTDGMNNAGKIDPITAAKMSEALGIRIYTIGAGTKGFAPFPVKDIWGRTVYRKVKIDVDENTLTEIARITGGKFFRATDTNSLREIYKEIDQLEKTEMEQFHYKQYKELFGYFLFAGLLILVLGWILDNTLFLRLP